MSRAYRYVNDHGDLYRMTETRYRRYLLAGTREDKFPDASEYGVCVGVVLTVNKLVPTDFNALYNAVHARAASRPGKMPPQVYECGRDDCPGTTGTSHRRAECPARAASKDGAK